MPECAREVLKAFCSLLLLTKTYSGKNKGKCTCTHKHTNFPWQSALAHPSLANCNNCLSEYHIADFLTITMCDAGKFVQVTNR